MNYWGWERLSTFPRFYIYYIASEGFPGGTVVEKPPASAGDTGDAASVPGSGRSLEKEVATHSSVLAGKIS